MKITSKLMKVNQSLELPQRESQSLPTKNGKLCCFQVCILSNGANCLECLQRPQCETSGTARRGEMRNGGSGGTPPTGRLYNLLCSLLTGQDLELGQAPRNSVLQTSIARWLLVLLYAAISWEYPMKRTEALSRSLRIGSTAREHAAGSSSHRRWRRWRRWGSRLQR